LKNENEDKGKGKKKEEDSDGGSTNLTYDDELLLVEEHDIVDSASSWVIDSGTSAHVTSKRDVFCSYTSGEFGDVKLAHKGCDHCFVEKKNKVSFEVHSPGRPEILDLVHCHLCGAMKTRTIGGSAYFLSFVDDHSRKTWVYTLKSKNDVLSMFKKFKVSVERETRKKLKCICIDNGGGFLRKIGAYCREVNR